MYQLINTFITLPLNQILCFSPAVRFYVVPYIKLAIQHVTYSSVCITSNTNRRLWQIMKGAVRRVIHGRSVTDGLRKTTADGCRIAMAKLYCQ